MCALHGPPNVTSPHESDDASDEEVSDEETSEDETMHDSDLDDDVSAADASKTTAKRARAANLLVVQDFTGMQHVLVPSTVQGVVHFRQWDAPGHITLAEPMPLIFPSADELTSLRTLGPRVSKRATWIAVVTSEREEFLNRWTTMVTTFHVTVGALSKINVSLARLCDDLRAFQPSLQSRATACALAHSPDAELKGLGLPPGARRAALQSLPGAQYLPRRLVHPHRAEEPMRRARESDRAGVGAGLDELEPATGAVAAV